MRQEPEGVRESSTDGSQQPQQLRGAISNRAAKKSAPQLPPPSIAQQQLEQSIIVETATFNESNVLAQAEKNQHQPQGNGRSSPPLHGDHEVRAVCTSESHIQWETQFGMSQDVGMCCRQYCHLVLASLGCGILRHSCAPSCWPHCWF